MAKALNTLNRQNGQTTSKRKAPISMTGNAAYPLQNVQTQYYAQTRANTAGIFGPRNLQNVRTSTPSITAPTTNAAMPTPTPTRRLTQQNSLPQMPLITRNASDISRQIYEQMQRQTSTLSVHSTGLSTPKPQPSPQRSATTAATTFPNTAAAVRSTPPTPKARGYGTPTPRSYGTPQAYYAANSVGTAVNAAAQNYQQRLAAAATSTLGRNYKVRNQFTNRWANTLQTTRSASSSVPSATPTPQPPRAPVTSMAYGQAQSVYGGYGQHSQAQPRHFGMRTSNYGQSMPMQSAASSSMQRMNGMNNMNSNNVNGMRPMNGMNAMNPMSNP